MSSNIKGHLQWMGLDTEDATPSPAYYATRDIVKEYASRAPIFTYGFIAKKLGINCEHLTAILYDLNSQGLVAWNPRQPAPSIIFGTSHKNKTIVDFYKRPVRFKA